MYTLDQAIVNSRKRISDKRRWDFYREMNHGKKILQSQEELEAYMSLYGEMHQFKCKAAIQSFPYEKLGYGLHLVDWGCGQGLATLCFLEALEYRGYLDRVQKITLIEPSVPALERAKSNVMKALEGRNVEIEVLNSKLPSVHDDTARVNMVNLNKTTTVHFFSNILDVLDVSLKKTAQIVESGRGIHFVLCMGPLDKNSARIDEFCEYFSQRIDFAALQDRNVGFTSDTNRATSCKIRCFSFVSENSAINDNVVEGHYDETGAFDDYDDERLVQNGILSQHLVTAYRKIAANAYYSEKVYLRPDIDGDTPDLLIMRKGRGLVVLNVFDKDLSKCYFNNGTFLCDGKPISSPLTVVRAICDSIMNEKSSEMLRNTLKGKNGWFAIRPAVWFPQADATQIQSVFLNDVQKEKQSEKAGNSGRTLLLDKNAFDTEDVWATLDLKRSRPDFTDAVYDELRSLLKSRWHTYREGDSSITLTRDQRDLAKSQPSRRQKISGVAGSGKTQVLAARAVNSYLRTGKTVLVLAFNITLVNYIKYRIGRIPADFLWEKIYTTNYHRFFASQARRIRKRMDLSSFSDKDFFEGYEGQLTRYSAILIDEAQDYEYEWFYILQKYFLEPDGELVIFGDVKQNIYKRSLDETKEIHTPIPGQWTKRLNIGHRFNNPRIASLSMEFQKYFFGDLPTDEIAPDLSLGFSTRDVLYEMMPSSSTGDEIAQRCLEIISANSLDLRNTIILSQTNDVLRGVDKAYRERTGQKPMTTFETKEYYDYLKENSADFDKDLRRIRDNKKTHFTMMTDQIKMSSIYSYKGWEADNVILLIQPAKEYIQAEDSIMAMPELVYTAITRARNNLFVINLGNVSFDNFFKYISY